MPQRPEIVAWRPVSVVLLRGCNRCCQLDKRVVLTRKGQFWQDQKVQLKVLVCLENGICAIQVGFDIANLGRELQTPYPHVEESALPLS